MMTRLSGDDLDYLKRFYAAFLKTRHGQILNWMVACCATSGKDVSADFVEYFHMPLSPFARALFRGIDWTDPDAPTHFFSGTADVTRYYDSLK